ncbi:MAG: hypothetical protein WBW16_00860 [Bacteroidota bacterium]
MNLGFSKSDLSEEQAIQITRGINRRLHMSGAGRKLFLLLLGVHLCGSQVSSQAVLTDIRRTAPVNARTAAMGDAYVAEPTDASDAYGNPAALVFLPGVSVFASHAIESKDEIMGENTAVSLPLGRSSCVGLGTSVTHTGYVKDSPRTSTKMKMIQYGLDLAYAQMVSNSLGMGFDLGVQSTRAGNLQLTQFTPSVGLLYTPSPEISYGIDYHAQGSPLEFSYDSTSATWKNDAQRQTIEAGATLRLRLWRKDPTLILALANEKVLGVKGIIYKGGIEFLPIEYLSVRVGYFATPQSLYTRYGLGMNLGPLRIDYLISPSHLSDRFHEIAAAFAF